MHKTLASLKARRRSDAGFTLLEVTIAAAILPIVLAAAYLVFITLTGCYSSISAQSEASSEGQRAMDGMVRELRQAQEITQGGGAFATATPTYCSFYCDDNHDGIPERITYYVDGTDLYRVESHSSTPAYPYVYVNGPATRVVNLSTSSSVVFTYYDESDPTNVDPTPNPPTICAVGVHLSASRMAQNGQVSVDFTTRVKIRALFDSIS
jgi:prepilin-type N-terminal cleavage/methylation domain-containing protein